MAFFLPSLGQWSSRALTAVVMSLLTVVVHAAPTAPRTERHYLTGQGPKDAIPWEFSVTSGRRAGEWTTIPVPSNWEQHGFGTYVYGEAPTRTDEHGLYRTRFRVPAAWKGRPLRLVFEGVMTDASVKVNGVAAGPTHIGGFYRFGFDISRLVKPGAGAENLLEVDVAKTSSNAKTAVAENKGDYWMFGGIFRPVWLESAPPQSIEHTAIDARADGSLTAEVSVAGVAPGAKVEAQVVDAAGRALGKPFSVAVPAQPPAKLILRTRIAGPRLWTAETPHLHTLKLSLRQGRKLLHASSERFGFRTFEVRKGDGLYLNGKRILLKGVNRHSFRPDTGRALNREDSYADARLIKQMNMNTARMSHYPPDKAFLEAADELGLYVLHELSGWQHAHDTEVGRRLVRELVTRDVNHPSVLFWDNGNEGGWNRELDNDFALYDPQRRNVLHPWELHGDIDTKHYSSYADLSKRLQGPHLLMPTEVLHGLFDGGGGTGLDDYWKAITGSPFGAGAIFWVFADEGIARSDRNGKIDVFSTYAPDGLVGPRHEKEGSFHTVRQLWSPVQVAAPVLDAGFDGKLSLTNHYDFTSLAQCRFGWELARYKEPGASGSGGGGVTVLASGKLNGPAIAPGASGQLDLKLPRGWRDRGADALRVTAYGPGGEELWSWNWATPALAPRLGAVPQGAYIPRVEQAPGELRLVAGDVSASFDSASGALRSLQRAGQTAALGNGPRLVYARAKKGAQVAWLPFTPAAPDQGVRRLAQARMANTIEIVPAMDKSLAYANYKLEISPDGTQWKTVFDASRRAQDGNDIDFPPQRVAAVRLSDITGPDGQAVVLKSLRLGYAASRFPSTAAASEPVTSGTGTDPKSGKPVAWIEGNDEHGLEHVRWSLHGDGTLQLDYRYALDGAFLYHGVTFDHPESAIKSLRWLGEGPFRSWQNRMHGTTLGVHEMTRTEPEPGPSFVYPEFQGFFAGLRWASFNTAAGSLTVTTPTPDLFLRVGTPRSDHQHTSVEFPAGDLSFMHAIPAMGSKFLFADQLGPAGQPATASGMYSGTLLIRFGR